jgi:hypothetical protein
MSMVRERRLAACWPSRYVSIMADQTLRVVQDRPRASVIIHAPPKGKMAMTGDGPDRLLCGNCAQPLAEGVSQEQIHGTLVQCPECGAFNEGDS